MTDAAELKRSQTTNKIIEVLQESYGEDTNAAISVLFNGLSSLLLLQDVDDDEAKRLLQWYLDKHRPEVLQQTKQVN